MKTNELLGTIFLVILVLATTWSVAFIGFKAYHANDLILWVVAVILLAVDVLFIMQLDKFIYPDMTAGILEDEDDERGSYNG